MTNTPKLIVVGHGRHGKDTFAEMLVEQCPGISTMSSSWFALEKVVFPVIGGDYGSLQECYDDRINRREEWFKLIRGFNDGDRARLARELFQEHQIYVGMRCRDEFLAARHLSDLTIWIDRSEVLPPEPATSLTIRKDDCDIIIDNNGSLADLSLRAVRLSNLLY